jgi:hypothetical protein
MAIVHQHDKRIGVTYAYESVSHWDKDKKQSRSKRHLIGIVDPETGEVKPTTKKKRETNTQPDSPATAAPMTETPWLYAKRTFFGVTYMLDCIASQINRVGRGFGGLLSGQP